VANSVGGLDRCSLVDRPVLLAGPVVGARRFCPLGADATVRGDADRPGSVLDS
jgi:hypothetical protein